MGGDGRRGGNLVCADVLMTTACSILWSLRCVTSARHGVSPLSDVRCMMQSCGQKVLSIKHNSYDSTCTVVQQLVLVVLLTLYQVLVY